MKEEKKKEFFHVSYAGTVLYQLAQGKEIRGQRASCGHTSSPTAASWRLCVGFSVAPTPLKPHVFQKSISSKINTTVKEKLRVMKLVTK